MDDLEEIRDSIEQLATDLVERTSLEVLCNVFGNVIHAFVCDDDSVSEDFKAAYVTMLVTTKMQPYAIDHFNTDGLIEKLNFILKGNTQGGLH